MKKFKVTEKLTMPSGKSRTFTMEQEAPSEDVLRKGLDSATSITNSMLGMNVQSEIISIEVVGEEPANDVLEAEYLV